MSNVLLAHTNRADASTLTNGSWLAGLPLNNLKDANIDKVARSTNALAASTIFAADMGSVLPIRAVALVNHNLSTAATWQVKGGTVAPDASNVFASGQVFDSGVMNVKQLTFNWDTPAAWGLVYPALYARDAASVRYVTVSITDTANAAGYVQVGRLFVGTGFQPGINASFGMQDAWQDLSSMTRADSGKKYFTRRTRRQRQVDFYLRGLTAAEGLQVHEMDGILGITEEVLYVPDPADMALSQRFGMLANIRDLSPLDYTSFIVRGKGYRLEEVL